jgi:hypothetical protein
MSVDDSSTFDGSREELRMNCAHILYFVELGRVSVQVFEKFFRIWNEDLWGYFRCFEGLTGFGWCRFAVNVDALLFRP